MYIIVLSCFCYLVGVTVGYLIAKREYKIK